MKRIYFQKTISVFLVVLLLASVPSALCMPVKAVDIQPNTNDLNLIDVLVAAHLFLSQDEATQNMWPSNVEVQWNIPLYGTDGSIVAWYLELSSGSYAVINNNIDNPMAVEYGVGGNKLIQEILSLNPNSRIIYNNPTDVYIENNSNARSNVGLDDYDDYFPNACQDNRVLSNVFANNLLSVTDAMGQASIASSYTDYGFIDWANLPDLSATGNALDLMGMSIAEMDTYESYAANHCGATCATNIALYFANLGYSNLKKNNSVNDTFASLYALIGPGPVFGISEEMCTYFDQRGYSLNYNGGITSYNSLKSSIANGRICSLLLKNSMLDWHWVVGFGWVQYSDGSQYVRVLTGWDQSTLKYYMYNGSATVESGLNYWIG